MREFSAASGRWSRRSGLAAAMAAMAAAAWACCGAAASACSVPVFRYALERWPADAYQVYVFHRGPLSDEETARLAVFEPASDEADEADSQRGANLAVHRCDLDDPQFADAVDKIAQLHPGATLPLVVVRSPWGAVVWSGPLDSPQLQGVADSPVRRELAARLLAGQTAVWLLLESGDPQRDDAAAQTLASQLQLLAKELKLPDPAALLPGNPQPGGDRQRPGAAPQAGVPTVDPSKLRIEFSILRVARDAAAEAVLTRMLLASEEGLDAIHEPMAFPVFGRGRVLYALAGQGINADNIREACEFLVGPCSCQVKEMNPGVDLLMDVAWSRLVEPIIDVELTLPPSADWQKLIGPGSVAQAGPVSPASPGPARVPLTQDELATAASPTAAAAASGGTRRSASTGGVLRRNLMLALLTLAGAVAAGTFVLMWRRPS